jgi:hypothetical protein
MSGRSVDPERPVENPEEFFGQQQVLRRIFARVEPSARSRWP